MIKLKKFNPETLTYTNFTNYKNFLKITKKLSKNILYKYI